MIEQLAIELTARMTGYDESTVEKHIQDLVLANEPLTADYRAVLAALKEAYKEGHRDGRWVFWKNSR